MNHLLIQIYLCGKFILTSVNSHVNQQFTLQVNYQQNKSPDISIYKYSIIYRFINQGITIVYENLNYLNIIFHFIFQHILKSSSSFNIRIILIHKYVYRIGFGQIFYKKHQLLIIII